MLLCVYSERQPRMTAIWDISEDIMYEEGRPEFSRIPRNNRLFKKSIVLDGMINLTEQGDRIAVVKATDADTNNTFGRIQARKVDDVRKKFRCFKFNITRIILYKIISAARTHFLTIFSFNFKENLRLEAFYNGKQQAALNVQQQPGGITNVTYEDIKTDEMCNDNSTSHDRNAYSSKCNVSRLLDTVVNDEVMELKIYQDLVYAIVEPMRINPYLDEAEREWKTLKEGKQWENGWNERQIADGSLFDIKLERNNDIVQCSTTLAFLGHKIIGLRGLIKQDEESRNTQIQLARTYTPEALLGYVKYTYPTYGYIPDEDPSYEDSGYNNTDYSYYEERLEGRYGRYNKTEEYYGRYDKLFENVREYAEVEDILNLEVKPTSGNTTDQYTVELKDSNDNKLSFDGWFGLANKIQEAVADMVPDIKRYLKDKQLDYEFMNYSNLTSAIPNFLHMHV